MGDTDSEKGSDKKIELNKNTKSAGLKFNVNSAKKWLLKLLAEQDIVEVKINGAHYAITAFCEELLNNLIGLTLKDLEKDKVELYTITYEILKQAVKDNEELNSFYIGRKDFNNDIIYESQHFM
jgi:hypothetical protein